MQCQATHGKAWCKEDANKLRRTSDNANRCELWPVWPELLDTYEVGPEPAKKDQGETDHLS